MKPIDTTNKFLVASTINNIVSLLNPPAPRQALTSDEALVLAAYLVALSGHEPDDLYPILEQMG